MRVFAVGVKLANVAAAQRSHDTNSREHRWAVALDHQHQRPDRVLAILAMLNTITYKTTRGACCERTTY
jgi:hypothetical protein